VILFHHLDELVGPDEYSDRTFVKQIESLGYASQSLFVKAEECGAPTWSSYFLTISCYKESSFSHHFHAFPSSLQVGLPPRPCQNLIKDFCIPKKAFSGNISDLCYERHPVFSNYMGTHKNIPVYNLQGPFDGTNPKAYIFMPSDGFRVLSNEEWRALKGVKKEDCASRKVIARSIETNVFSCLGSSLASSIFRPVHLPPSRPPGSHRQFQAVSSTIPNQQLNKVWSPPDLSVGSTFYTNTVRKLQLAVKTLPPSEQYSVFLQGLEILSFHRNNYHDSISRLVLLWWEWPPCHWDGLRLGTSMNFMKTPTSCLVPNQIMNADETMLASKFVDELIRLGVLKTASTFQIEIRNNFPLFLVPKPGQPGESRCIADGARGGQNEVCVPDPCFMTSPDHILPRLYRGGWSATLDMSKYFHLFLTAATEKQFLGLIHPKSGEKLFYDTFPMGTCNSPAASGRFGAAFIRLIIESSPLFQGSPIDNSLVGMILDKNFDPSLGQGRVLIGLDGLPALLIWLHIDDILLHGPTEKKVLAGFQYILDEMVRLGLICHYSKTTPPTQCVKFCGFYYDTNEIPTLRIPDSKISRGLGLVSFLQRGVHRSIARLTLSKVVGYLQSLVPATPSHLGASFLHYLYDDLHNLKDPSLQGTLPYYFTPVTLSAESNLELQWWEQALGQGLLTNQSQTLHMSSFGVAWGDGSGTGTGGSFNQVSNTLSTSLEPLHTWMGVWNPSVLHFSSNWKELRTLLLSMERLLHDQVSVTNQVLWYLTDNQVTYDVCRRSSSSSVELLKLIKRIRTIELRLTCKLEVIHVPGTLMQHQGTDGLSRGVLIQPFAHNYGITSLQSLFRPADLTVSVLEWGLTMAGCPYSVLNLPWKYLGDLDAWDRSSLLNSNTVCCLSPHMAKQGIIQALNSLVESPWDSQHLFIIPRVMQRDFGRLSKYISYIGYGWDVPVSFTPVVPFLVYYLPPFNRLTAFLQKSELLDNRVDSIAPPSAPYWVRKQVETLQWM
jgi:hypothetical protein